jgi:hypothetical protein
LLVAKSLKSATASPELDLAASADLVVMLAAATFLKSNVLPFKLKATPIHDQVDEDASALPWEDVIRLNKTKY